MAAQLLLPLQKENLLRFADFCEADNLLTLQTLQNWDQAFQMIYLSGPTGSGKTHLAEAVAEQFLSQHKTVLLISGKTVPAPHFFYDLPTIDYLIVDDVDALLAFSSQYEEALFALYNQVFDRPETRLLFTSALALDVLPIRLKDLQSRLQAMLQLVLAPPSEKTLAHSLALHAKRLQLDLSEPILAFLLKNASPNICTQMTTLKRLAEDSLTDQKALSLAYVRRLLKAKN